MEVRKEFGMANSKAGNCRTESAGGSRQPWRRRRISSELAKKRSVKEG
jgi:hypothetical protein